MSEKELNPRIILDLEILIARFIAEKPDVSFLVYFAGGPVLLIRAEQERVLLGFWRGQRLQAIEPRLRPGGKYEMATVDLRESDDIHPAVVTELTRAAIRLNAEHGNPTKI